MKKINLKIYILAFLLTSSVFVIAIITSNFFNNERMENIKQIEEKMSIDILSLETQFQLLENLSCEYISEGSTLSRELVLLGSKLTHMENRAGADDEEVKRLKRYYSLLQIKDILLMEKIAKKCDLKPTVLLYFYSNEDNQSTCAKQGYVLTRLSKKHSNLRIYSFDYNLDLPVLKTLISINNVNNNLPAMVVGDKVHYGLHKIETIEDLLPTLAKNKNDEDKDIDTKPEALKKK